MHVGDAGSMQVQQSGLAPFGIIAQLWRENLGGLMLRKFGIGVAIVAIVLTSAWIWATREVAPTHPALVGALPPVISLQETYVDRSAVWNFKVSADGTLMAHRATRRITEGTRIAEVESGKEIAFLPEVYFVDWEATAPVLNVLHDGRFWRMDPKRPDRANWQDITPRGLSSWQLMGTFSDLTGRSIVASSDRNPAFADLYSVNTDGGDTQLLIRNEGQTLYWVMDAAQNPVLRVDRVGDDGQSVLVRRGEAWQEVFTLGPDNASFFVFAQDPEENFWALSARGRDTRALVKVSAQDGSETVVVEAVGRDIDQVFILSNLRPEPDFALLANGPHQILPISPRGKVFADLVAQIAPEIEVEAVFPTGSGRFVTATLSPSALSYEYWMFDLEAGTSRRLAEFPFRTRNLDKLAASEWVTIPARDGLGLSGVLVRPKGISAPAPLVIEVHGGPAAHDIWQYNHFRQYLANRGYAVLSVNYRGSTGQGRAFQEAGFRTYGRAMQDDLVDAARWAVAQGIADADAIAVMGTSHGGYMAAMAVLRDPDVFKAAVVEFPMLDIAYSHDFFPQSWGLSMFEMTRYFGKPDVAEDRAEMVAHSPVTHVEGLTRPILLHAGRWDRITGFEQAEDFLRKAGDKAALIDFHIFDEAGHGVDRWQDRVTRARRIEAFLHDHLGGRKEGFSLAPVAAEWID